VRLLQNNGLGNCYHELDPDLLYEGVQFYYQRIDEESITKKIRATRSGITFESNNRLFSLAGPIRLAFPDAKFVFLFRNGYDVVRSGLQRKWYQLDDPFGSARLGAQECGSVFEKTCRYWTDVNARIMHDLEVLGCDYVPIRFEDLIEGRGLKRLQQLFQLSRFRWSSVPVANNTAYWCVPPHEDWNSRWRDQFAHICGDMMKRLGYPLASPAGTDRVSATV